MVGARVTNVPRMRCQALLRADTFQPIRRILFEGQGGTNSRDPGSILLSGLPP